MDVIAVLVLCSLLVKRARFCFVNLRDISVVSSCVVPKEGRHILVRVACDWIQCSLVARCQPSESTVTTLGTHIYEIVSSVGSEWHSTNTVNYVLYFIATYFGNIPPSWF